MVAKIIQDSGAASQDLPEWLHSAAEIDKELTQTKWIVDNVFRRESFYILSGDPNSKKTWVLLDLSVCIAGGLPWLGKDTEQGPVLYLDEEMGLTRMRNRLRGLIGGHDKRGAELALRFTTYKGWDFGDARSVAELHGEAIKPFQPSLVVIDSFSKITGGRDENSASEMQTVLNNLQRTSREFQCAVIVIHHNNKGNGTLRGSTAIEASVDGLIECQSSPATDATIKLSSRKARDGDLLSLSARLCYNNGENIYLEPCDAKPTNDGKPKLMRMPENQELSPKRQDIVSHLTDIAVASRQDLERIGGPDAVNWLVKNNYIYRFNPEAGNRTAYYRLVERRRDSTA